MKNKKEIIEKIKNEIDEFIEKENLVDKFIDECCEVESYTYDIDVVIEAKIDIENGDVLDVGVCTTYPQYSYMYDSSSTHRYICVYIYSHKSYDEDYLFDSCIDAWKEDHNKGEEDDYDYDEVYTLYQSVYKDNFDISSYYNNCLDYTLKHYLKIE